MTDPTRNPELYQEPARIPGGMICRDCGCTDFHRDGCPGAKRMDDDELLAQWRALALQERFKRQALQVMLHTALESFRGRWAHQDGEFCAWALWQLYMTTLDIPLPADMGELELPDPSGGS